MRIRTPRDLGLMIRDRRRRLGLDQRDLSLLLGVSRKWLIDIEKGKPRAALGLALQTLNALDLFLDVNEGVPAKTRKGAGKMVDIDKIVATARRSRT